MGILSLVLVAGAVGLAAPCSLSVPTHEHAMSEASRFLPKAKDESTPLMRAAFMGNAQVVSELLNGGAKPNGVTSKGETALHWASKGGHPAVVAVLARHGADVNRGDQHGTTPLMRAAAKGSQETALALINAGADPKRANKSRKTALHLAIEGGHLDVATVLIQRGADVNAVDSDQYSPLMKAATRGNAEAVRLLLAAGADVSQRNARADTARDLAQFLGHSDVLALLGGRASPIPPWPSVGDDYDDAPKAINITRPSYPDWAFREKKEGTVIVEILIDTTGRVARARVIQSVPDLDDAALDTVREWRFEPARKNGEAMPTIAHAPVVFGIY